MVALNSFFNALLCRKLVRPISGLLFAFYFDGARGKGFARLRNVSKLHFFDKIGHAKSVGFRFYSAI